MSRRITFFVLATSAALIATQATADPECFGDTCHLPEVVEPSVAAVQPPEADEPAALETSASVQNPAPVKALPEVVAPYVTRQEARQEARPEIRPVEASKPVAAPQVAAVPAVADQTVRQPVLPKQVDDVSTSRKPAKVAHAAAPRQAAAAREPVREPVSVTEAAPAAYARSARVLSPEPAYTVTPAASAGAVVVVVPGSAYAGYRGAPGYLIAPGAKIISIDTED